MSSGSRRSKRKKADNDQAAPQRINPRIASYCLEFGLPSNLCCSGCIDFAHSASVGVIIDGCQEDEWMRDRLKEKLADRSNTHTASRCDCRQPWTWPENSCEGTLEENWMSEVKGFIQKHHGRIHVVEAIAPTPAPVRPLATATATPAATATATPAAAAATAPNTQGGDEDLAARELNCATPSPTNAQEEPPTKKLRTVNKSSHIVNSQRQQFEAQDAPNGHVAIRKDECARLQQMQERVKTMQNSLKRQRSMQDATPAFRTAMSVALASTPGPPMSAAACQFPVVVAGFLEQCGLMDLKDVADQSLQNDKGKNQGAHAASFPSEKYMRQNMLDTAAESLLALGKKLSAQGNIYLACDKGHKQGVEHFVKMLSWFEDGQAETRLIDINASGGTNVACGEAVGASLKNLNCPNIFLLAGQCTDSGGGGALEGLAKELQRYGLCAKYYLVGPCNIHCLQLQLSNPTIKLFGEGGLQNRNVMQLLHGVCLIEDCLEWEEVMEALDIAQEFYDQNFDKDIDETKGTKGDKDFAKRWNKMRRFRSFEKINPPTTDPETGRKTAKWKKAPACVLTRWGYVGASAVHGCEMHLLLVKFCQMIVNRFKASDKRNKAASDVQSPLSEEEVHCDACFLKSFHLGCFNSHLAWLMETKDVSGHPSFQSHNILVRCYVMHTELTDLKDHLTVDNEDFEDWRNAINNLLSEERISEEQDMSQQFLAFALRSLNQHFNRFCGRLFLPAALMAEEPLAEKVALVMVGDSKLTPADQALCHSKVHKRIIDVNDFFAFVEDRAHANVLEDDDADGCVDGDLDCATKFLEGVRHRDITQWKDASVQQKHMWRRFLPFPSQTHHVEAGVKECKIVSTTGREEEMRSAYAVVRSLRLLPIGTLRKMDIDERTLKTLKAVRDHVVTMEGLQDAMGDAYRPRFNKVRESLQQKHFKKERLGGLKDQLRSSAESNKRNNVRQNKTGVDDTAVTLGIIPYSGKDGLRKGTVVCASLKLELKERGLTEEEVAGLKNYTTMVKKLKEMEIERVTSSDEHPNENAKTKALECAAKGFLQQTNPDEASFEN